MTKKITKFLFYFSCLIAVVSLGVFYFPELKIFQVSQIPVVIENRPGHNFFLDDKVDTLQAELGYLKSKNVWLLNLKKVYQEIREKPWVSGLTIKRIFPNQVKVDVVPKEVLAVIMNDKRQLQPVHIDGVVSAQVRGNLLPDVPVLRFIKTRNTPENIAHVISLYNGIIRDGFFASSNISEIIWNSEDGLSISLLKPKVEILFGTEEIDKRSKRVQGVLSYLETQPQKVRVIDSRFSKKVLVRLRKDP